LVDYQGVSLRPAVLFGACSSARCTLIQLPNHLSAGLCRLVHDWLSGGRGFAAGKGINALVLMLISWRLAAGAPIRLSATVTAAWPGA
jgi:hypothetical protein